MMGPLKKWRRELYKLDIQSQEQPVHTLPAVVGEWFDTNLEVLADAVSPVIGAARLKALEGRVRQVQWSPDWCVALIEGWSVRIVRYERGEQPCRYMLLMIARGPTQPDLYQMAIRSEIVERLGGDVDDDLLMSTGPDERPELISFWTWAINAPA
jgi:hypothetical protein